MDNSAQLNSGDSLHESCCSFFEAHRVSRYHKDRRSKTIKNLRSFFVFGLVTVILLANHGPILEAGEAREIPETFTPALTAYELINEEYINREAVSKRSLVNGAVKGLEAALPKEIARTTARAGPEKIDRQGLSLAEVKPTVDLKPAVKLYREVLAKAASKTSLEKERLVKGAISGMLEALGDSYATVFTKEEFERFARKRRGNYVGLGIEIAGGKNSVELIEIYPDTPASRSPLRTGDHILKIDGRATVTMSFAETAVNLAGKKGTQVELLVEHKGDSEESITLTRREIKIPAVEYDLLLEGQIALLDINRFTSVTERELKRYLKKTERYFVSLNDDPQSEKSKELGKIYGLLGNAYSEAEKYNRALEHYSYAIELLASSEQKHRELIAQTYDNLGSVYRETGKQERAIELHRKALKFYRKFCPGKKYEMARIYENIGRTLMKTNKTEKAVQALRSAREILTETPDRGNLFLGKIYHYLGLVLKREKKIDAALKHQKQAKKFFKSSSKVYYYWLSRVYGALATLYRKKGEINKTMDYYKKQSKAKRRARDKTGPRINLHNYGNSAGGYGLRSGAGKEIEQYKKDIMALQGFRGFIVDLRNNSGGALNPTVNAISQFVDSGLVIEYIGTRNENRPYDSLGNSFPDFPVAILINARTASAAELFAAAIREKGKGVLVGRRSHGKSSVQTVYEIGNGFMVRLTTGKYCTPSGKMVPKIGLKPDLTSPEYREDLKIAKEWILGRKK